MRPPGAALFAVPGARGRGGQAVAAVAPHQPVQRLHVPALQVQDQHQKPQVLVPGQSLEREHLCPCPHEKRHDDDEEDGGGDRATTWDLIGRAQAPQNGVELMLLLAPLVPWKVDSATSCWWGTPQPLKLELVSPVAPARA